MPVGFAIFRRSRKISPELIARFRALPAANVSDSMSRLFAGGPTLRPMHAGGVMAGPAFTVKTRPGDNLLVHKALDIAEPGDIVVVDAGGDLTNAIIGEIMTAYAELRGVGGIVINGAIRDSESLRARHFPVYAAGVTHRGPYKDGPGEINVPVAIGGMVVAPGDLVLGDADGLVAVPLDEAEKIAAAAEAKHAAEDKTLADIRAGRAPDRAWVDATLQRLGCNTEPR
ncbi:MAG: RraA family protein [Acidisphaera sp.]|nr:RraA family protein [Acidisphaera sp.]